MKLVDGTQCRVFYSKAPEWKMTAISRLQKTPCPVCRKDFICKCMDQWSGDLHQQMINDEWMEKHWLSNRRTDMSVGTEPALFSILLKSLAVRFMFGEKSWLKMGK